MKATRCILEGDLGKCARRRPADADLSPSRSAAGVPASPPLHSWLSVSGSEVLLGEAGLDPNLLSTLQISWLEKGIVPACLRPSLPFSLLSFLLLLLHVIIELLPLPGPKQVLEINK